jgi:hypothetical protein
MKPYTWTKQPSETRKLEFGGSRSLPTGDTFVSATAVMYDEDGNNVSASMISGSPSVSGDKIYVIVYGGTHNKTYYLKILATTSGGEVIEDDLVIVVKQIGK